MNKFLVKSKVIRVAAFFLLIGGMGVSLSACFNTAINSSFESRTDESPFLDRKNNEVEFKTEGNYFQIHKDGKWEPFVIRGVNMGAAKPGFFPGEMGIAKEDYLRWFGLISDMGANTLRVYTILSPAFYEALYEYNLTAGHPLYLFHGVWLDEDVLVELKNVYDPIINDTFEKDIMTLIDLLHGGKTVEPQPGRASGDYLWDVSDYIVGYIFGIEVNADVVNETNEINPEKDAYAGLYLAAEQASPYECWLAKIGDLAITYEFNKYGKQKNVSWTNWLTTDMLSHSNEPDPETEDAAEVNTEHIRATEAFTAGLFASYHIYPYYPEFIVFQPEYAEYTDNKGVKNPYKAYLRDLKREHTVPVLVAEFGMPASRGVTHLNRVTGFNQGGITEKQQGEYLVSMFEDIIDSDYAGGLVFSWQDEWFKRSWNTMDFDLPDRRAYWSNCQVSEQCFGLLAFEPGGDSTTCYPGAGLDDWSGAALISEIVDGDGSEQLLVKNDEKYVYFLIKDADVSPSVQYVIAADTINGQGNYQYGPFRFTGAADFVIDISGEENSTVLVDAYYDSFYRMYSSLAIVDRNQNYEIKNSGIFTPMLLCLSNELFLPETEERIPFSTCDAGKLLHGVTDPVAVNYNSLADFYIDKTNNAIEIRIPWMLLNVMDPSSKTIMGDLYGTNSDSADTQEVLPFVLTPQKIDGFTFELAKRVEDVIQIGGGGLYTWDEWDTPTYHERLKESYYVLQEAFNNLSM